MLAVEIGAGDGEHAAALAALGWKVHTFEPCTVMRAKAWAILRGKPGVILLPYAVGGNDRPATLYRCNGPDASLHNVGEPVEQCTVISMNHWFVTGRVGEIGMLFLDCNGSEVEILEQMVACDRMRQVRSIWWAGDERVDLLEHTHRKVGGAWERIE